MSSEYRAATRWERSSPPLAHSAQHCCALGIRSPSAGADTPSSPPGACGATPAAPWLTVPATDASSGSAACPSILRRDSPLRRLFARRHASGEPVPDDGLAPRASPGGAPSLLTVVLVVRGSCRRIGDGVLPRAWKGSSTSPSGGSPPDFDDGVQAIPGRRRASRSQRRMWPTRYEGFACLLNVVRGGAACARLARVRKPCRPDGRCHATDLRPAPTGLDSPHETSRPGAMSHGPTTHHQRSPDELRWGGTVLTSHGTCAVPRVPPPRSSKLAQQPDELRREHRPWATAHTPCRASAATHATVHRVCRHRHRFVRLSERGSLHDIALRT